MQLPTLNLPEIDVARLARLRRAKRFATGLLIAMAIVFVAGRLGEQYASWMGFVRAFAEASVVGALADWFAVTALFRHPLGLPIPHTAIIPRQKDAFGATLARFVKENFLVVEAFEPKVRGVDYAGSASRWLQTGSNAQRLSANLGTFTVWFLDALDNTELRHFLTTHLQVTLRRLEVTPLISQLLDFLTAGDHHQKLLDTMVHLAREQLDENKQLIRHRIGERSPWWLPKFVDEEIYDRIVAEIYALLDSIGEESGHPARRRFNQVLQELVDAMRNDPEVIARGEKIKEEILAQPSIQQYLLDLWQQAVAYLSRESADADSALRRRIEQGLIRSADELLADEAVRRQINTWLGDAVLYVVGQYRSEISEVITETVKRWDADATSRRVELQVGPDLQFIRINGTIVGGLVGLGLYAAASLVPVAA